MSEKTTERQGIVVEHPDGHGMTLVVTPPDTGEPPWRPEEAKSWLMRMVEEAIDHNFDAMEDPPDGFSMILAPWLTDLDFCGWERGGKSKTS